MNFNFFSDLNSENLFFLQQNMILILTAFKAKMSPLAGSNLQKALSLYFCRMKDFLWDLQTNDFSLSSTYKQPYLKFLFTKHNSVLII